MKYLSVLKYPPDYDGELHIKIEVTPRHALKINLEYAQVGAESINQTLRRLGRDLTQCPLSVREEK